MIGERICCFSLNPQVSATISNFSADFYKAKKKVTDQQYKTDFKLIFPIKFLLHCQ